MPFTKIWIHTIWSVKKRDKLIPKELMTLLLEHIIENAKQKEIFIKILNCVSDHIRILISPGNEQSISKLVMSIEGGSSN